VVPTGPQPETACENAASNASSSEVQSHPIPATTRQAKGSQEVDGVIAFEADQGNDHEIIRVSNLVIPQVPSR
jgi:hypothetical protein